MRKCAVIIAMLFACVLASAQTTKVRGSVIDADTGEPIPFAGIYFKGTTIGLTADIDGRFTLETRDPAAKVLVCQLLGYDTQETQIKHGAYTEVEFRLQMTDNRLSGSFVKADNRKIRQLLANIDKHRARNDPDLRPHYKCKVYNKMELDLTHPKEQLDYKTFKRNFGFVFDYMDTSVVSGVPYLPAMISETVVERRHTAEPYADAETIEANRISGINPDHNLLTQFTGSMHLKANFYHNFINAFNVEFPSPIQNGGLLYYNYFIIDTLQMDGRKTYLVRYHPKNGISSPALDGEMRIDAEDYALRSIRAKMKHGGNVNWLRDIVVESEYQRLPDSTWFFSQDKLYADFSIALGDSSRVMSVIGMRQLNYSDMDFESEVDASDAFGKVKVLPEATHMPDEYWEQQRPYDLTDREKGIYTMVDRVQKVPLYKGIYNTVYTLANEYLDIGPIGFGPYMSIVSSNNLEGFKPRLGIHTSKNLSTNFRWTGYIAYGFGDHQFKGGLTYERKFRKDPWSKLTMNASYDAVQLGKGSSNLTSGNILSSIWGRESKLVNQSNFSAMYEHEFSMNFNMFARVEMKRWYANPFVPMMTWGPDGTLTPVPSVAVNEVRLTGRFSWEETVNRGYFEKSFVHTDYPILTLDLGGSIPGIRQGDVGYFKPQVFVDWKFRVPPLGMSDMHFNAGAIFGQVPWMTLQMFDGNATGMLDKSAFSCMEYFEFAADKWATLSWYHTFNGFFLGKIPLISKLQLREEVSAKIAYGTLSDRNNGTDPKYGALMQFPVYNASGMMQPLDGVPYVELSAGVSNIFRLFRFDFVWRVTHREKTLPDGSVVTARGAMPLWNMRGSGTAAFWDKVPSWFPNAVTIGMEIRF